MYGKGTPNGMQVQPDRIAFTESCAKAIIKRQALETAQARLQAPQGGSSGQAEPKPMAAPPAVPKCDASSGRGDVKAPGVDDVLAVAPGATSESITSTTSSSVSVPAASAEGSTGLSFAARAAAKAASAPVQQRPQAAATAAKMESKEEARDRMYQEAFERMRKMKEQQQLLRKQQEEEVCSQQSHFSQPVDRYTLRVAWQLTMDQP